MCNIIEIAKQLGLQPHNHVTTDGKCFYYGNENNSNPIYVFADSKNKFYHFQMTGNWIDIKDIYDFNRGWSLTKSQVAQKAKTLQKKLKAINSELYIIEMCFEKRATKAYRDRNR